MPFLIAPILRSVVLALALAALPMVATTACSAPDVPSFQPTTSTPKKKKTPSKSGDSADERAGSTPTLAALTPDSIAVGTAPGGLEVTLTGARFAAGAKVDAGGTELNATLSSPTELKIRIPESLLSKVGALPISVKSASGTSNALAFTVANPKSVSITTLNPASASVSGPDVSLTVSGAGFLPASVVRFNGTPLATSFRSGTELGATIPSSALQSAGRVSVTVASGDDVMSMPASFDVQNPPPTITTLSPNTAVAGTASVAITVNGSGFTRSSEVVVGQTPLVTTFVTSSQLTATIPQNLLATAGPLQVKVQTPSPGGGASGSATFTISPATTSTNPTTNTGCQYACADYGYEAGECFEGWQCNAATRCLAQRDCSTVNGTNTGGTSNSSCLYKCSDYGYAPGQCSKGWICLADGAYAGCLGQTTCN